MHAASNPNVAGPSRNAFLRARPFPPLLGLPVSAYPSWCRTADRPTGRAFAVAAPVDAEVAEFRAWDSVSSLVTKKREDLSTILVLGAGPIIIGQVSERLHPLVW